MANKKLEILIKMRDDIRGAQRSIESLNKTRVAATGVGVALGTVAGIIGAKLLFEFRRLAVEGPRALIRTRIEVDRIINTLSIAEGSTAAANVKFRELFAISQEFGREFGSLAKGFARLSAAAKGTNLEGKKTDDILRGIVVASTALGLSAADTTGIIFAFEQIISKNTVSAEEIRRQLGDRLPGAFQIAARSIGVTTQELGKMLEQGTLLAEDLLPALSAELEKVFGAAAEAQAASLIGDINRLTNEFLRLKVELGDAGFIDAVSDAFQRLTNLIKDPETKQDLAELVSFFSSLASILTTVAEKAAFIHAVLSNFGELAGTGLSAVLFGSEATQTTTDADFSKKFPTPEIRDVKGERLKQIDEEAEAFAEALASSNFTKFRNIIFDPGKLKELNAALRKELEFATATPQQKLELLNKELELLEKRKELRQTEAVFELGVEGVLPEDALEQIELESQKERLEIVKEIARTESGISNEKLQKMTALLGMTGNAIGGISSALADATFGVGNFGQAFLGILRQIIAKLIETAIKVIIINLILAALGVPVRFNLGGRLVPATAGGIGGAAASSGGGIFGGGGGGSFGTPPFIPGAASGGYQPGGPKLSFLNERGSEFVFDAPSTRNLGPGFLQNLMEKARFPDFSLGNFVAQYSPAVIGAASGGGGGGGGGGISALANAIVNPNVNVEGHKGVFNLMLLRDRQEMFEAMKSSEGQAIMLDFQKQHSLEIGGI